MKVQNMTSATGRSVPNQFIITDGEVQYFQSYKTIIAKRDTSTGKTWLDAGSWDYSTTTGKYRNRFLGQNKAQTEKLIKSGEIQLVNLN